MVLKINFSMQIRTKVCLLHFARQLLLFFERVIKKIPQERCRRPWRRGPGSRYSSLEYSNIRRPKLYLLGLRWAQGPRPDLRATAASADLFNLSPVARRSSPMTCSIAYPSNEQEGRRSRRLPVVEVAYVKSHYAYLLSLLTRPKLDF